jgi:hypothetical protein
MGGRTLTIRTDLPAGGEDAADPPTQLGFRFGAALDGGDRAQPGV